MNTRIPCPARRSMLSAFGCALALFLTTGLATAQEEGINKGEALLKQESLGGLKLDMTEKAFSPILGKAAVKKTSAVLEGATGEYYSTWTCADKGVTLRMSSGETKKGTPKIAGITATQKCTLATAKGIKIGSSHAEVVKAYGKYEDKEMSRPDSFVAGSVYGGIIFTFQGGKVSEIFFGAAAE